MMWKRTATGIVAVVVVAATAVAVSASDTTLAMANSTIRPKLPPLTSPLTIPKPFLSTGTGPATGVLITARDQTLYYNDQDSTLSIACVGSCAVVWRPLIAPKTGSMSLGPGLTGNVSTVVRPNGTSQVTYAGHPLYTYSVDAIGHLTGNGLIDAYNGRAYSWHAVTATGDPLPEPSATPTPGSGGPSTPSTPFPSPSSPLTGSPTPSPTLPPAVIPTVQA